MTVLFAETDLLHPQLVSIPQRISSKFRTCFFFILYGQLCTLNRTLSHNSSTAISRFIFAKLSGNKSESPKCYRYQIVSCL